MLDVNALRSFLVALPRPTKILVTTMNDEKQEVLPPKNGRGGITWAGVSRSIEALNPAVVELFNETDQLLRAMRCDAKVVTPAEELPAILARDAESARVALFARHIADAYKFSVETAFTKLVEMFERLDRRQELLEVRLERTEREYRRAMQEKIDDAFEEAEEAAKEAAAQQADPAAAIVSSFLGGVGQGQAAPQAPNGKGK